MKRIHFTCEPAFEDSAELIHKIWPTLQGDLSDNQASKQVTLLSSQAVVAAGIVGVAAIVR